jgi:FAD/FMN-containing dehydrogenase
VSVFDGVDFNHRCEVTTDPWTREYYSVDSSHHQIYPEAVCFPKCKEDIKEVLHLASRKKLPVSSRGAGTSLLGQSLSAGLILDFTKYMNKILDLDLQLNTVLVQPGLVKGLLEKELKKHNKFLPPNPASGNYCTIGGMVSNNSSGPYGLGYGSILEYLQRIDLVYSDGSDGFAEGRDCDPRLRRTLSSFISSSRDFLTSYPDVSKNSCGYRLDAVFTRGFDSQNIFAASEGTLAILDSIKLKIKDLPLFRSLYMVHFPNVLSACSYAKKILRTNPVALELLDESVMDANIKSTIATENGCLLFIEYFYQTEGEIDNLQRTLTDTIQLGGKIIDDAHDLISINNLWNSRKNALNTAIKHTVGNRKPLTLFEDTAVSINYIYDYVTHILKLYKEHNLSYVIYGHLGNGNLHTRPITGDDIFIDKWSHRKQYEAMESLTLSLFTKVYDLRGTITAEHGDGISRTPYIKNVYNEHVVNCFRQIKSSLDPLNILNPGKIVM